MASFPEIRIEPRDSDRNALAWSGLTTAPADVKELPTLLRDAGRDRPGTDEFHQFATEIPPILKRTEPQPT